MCLTIISQLLFDLAEVRPSHHPDSNPSPQLLKELRHVWSHTLKTYTDIHLLKVCMHFSCQDVHELLHIPTEKACAHFFLRP